MSVITKPAAKIRASEKALERKFNSQIAILGGRSYKLPAVYVAGLPDRMALLPNGTIFFAEIKSTGKKPTPIQKILHKRLRALGFNVYIIDSLESLSDVIAKYNTV